MTCAVASVSLGCYFSTLTELCSWSSSHRDNCESVFPHCCCVLCTEICVENTSIEMAHCRWSPYHNSECSLCFVCTDTTWLTSVTTPTSQIQLCVTSLFPRLKLVTKAKRFVNITRWSNCRVKNSENFHKRFRQWKNHCTCRVRPTENFFEGDST